MKIDKEKFYELWNEVYTRLQHVPHTSGEYYYLSGCADVLRKINEQMLEKENE